jgi:hypothetical protein
MAGSDARAAKERCGGRGRADDAAEPVDGDGVAEEVGRKENERDEPVDADGVADGSGTGEPVDAGAQPDADAVGLVDGCGVVEPIDGAVDGEFDGRALRGDADG